MFGLGLAFDYRPADTRTFAAGREQRNTVTLDPMLKALLVHMASWRLWEESGKGEVLGRPLVLRDMGWRAARRRSARRRGRRRWFPFPGKKGRRCLVALPKREGGWLRSSRRGRRGTTRKAERLAGWEGPELLALNKSWRRRKRRGSQGKTMMGEAMERREGGGRGRRVVREVGARLPLRSP